MPRFSLRRAAGSCAVLVGSTGLLFHSDWRKSDDQFLSGLGPPTLANTDRHRVNLSSSVPSPPTPSVAPAASYEPARKQHNWPPSRIPAGLVPPGYTPSAWIATVPLIELHGDGHEIVLTAPHGIPLARENCIGGSETWACTGTFKMADAFTTAIASQLASDSSSPLRGLATALTWNRQRAGVAAALNRSALKDPNFMLQQDAPTDRWNMALAHIALTQQENGWWRWPQQLRSIHSSSPPSHVSDDDGNSQHRVNSIEFTEMPLLVDLHGMSDEHGVDVALGLHPLEVAAWAPRSPGNRAEAGPGMATTLRACLRRELTSRLGELPLPIATGRGRGAGYNSTSTADSDFTSGRVVATSSSPVVVDGLNYFTGDWADSNQTHYNPLFRDRLTLSAQAVLLRFPAVQIEMSRRLRLALTDGTMPHLLPALGEALFQCAAEVKAWQRKQAHPAGTPSKMPMNSIAVPSAVEIEAQESRMVHDRQEINQRAHETHSGQSQRRGYDSAHRSHHKGR